MDGGSTFTPTSPAFGGGNPDLGPPNSTGGPPFVEPSPGTQFSPDFQFAIDPNNPDSTANFINALLTALGPGIASGQFSNFQTQEGATGNQSQQTAQNLFNQLGGGDPFRTLLRNSGASSLANPLGEQTPGIQGFLEQQLRSQIEGGGISDQFVQAARDRILGPANEALLGRLNRQGGGVADINSPLFQEQQRKQEADFANDLILFGGQNLQNSLGQAGQLGSQQFGQGLANRQFGAGTQGQLTGQDLNLGGLLSQLGLGQQGLDLQNQGQQNQFGLGQSSIAADLIRTLMGQQDTGGSLGTILALLTGDQGILQSIPDIVDIFKKIPGLGGNPKEGDVPGSTPPIAGEDRPPREDRRDDGGGFDIRDLLPFIAMIPGLLGDRSGGGFPGGFPPNFFDQFDASNGLNFGPPLPPSITGGIFNNPFSITGGGFKRPSNIGFDEDDFQGFGPSVLPR